LQLLDFVDLQTGRLHLLPATQNFTPPF